MEQTPPPASVRWSAWLGRGVLLEDAPLRKRRGPDCKIIVVVAIKVVVAEGVEAGVKGANSVGACEREKGTGTLIFLYGAKP